MKKIFLICFLILSSLIGFSQVIVNRAGASNTVSDARLQAQYNLLHPRYADTTAANVQKGIDSCGATIYTRTPQAMWYRACNPKRWMQIVDSANLVSIINNTTNSISILDSNTFVVCHGDNVCDTFHSNINFNTIQLITDSSVRVCSVDTAGGAVVSVCDTINIGGQQITYFFQNGVRNTGGGIVEMGDNDNVYQGAGMIKHNTFLDLLYSKLVIPQATVYDYGVQFRKYPNFGFQVGTGLTSWLHENKYTSPNTVRLGINFTDSVYDSGIPGYMGSSHAGYWFGTNLTGNGSYGLGVDNTNAKYSGLFFHTSDTLTDDAITFFGARPPHSTYVSQIALGQTLESSRIMTLHTNGNVRLYAYDSSTRNDGVLTKALGTDELGNVILGTVNSGTVWGDITGTLSNQLDLQAALDDKQNNVHYYRVEDYGAVGNGVTNDAAAFQATIDAMPSRGGIIQLFAKTYLINSVVNITKPITIMGQGADNNLGLDSAYNISNAPTKLLNTNGTSSIFEVQSPAVIIEKIAFEHSGGPTPIVGCYAIYVTSGNPPVAVASTPPGQYPSGFKIYDCTFARFYDNIHIKNGWEYWIENCYIGGAVNANVYVSNDALCDGGDGTITGCQIYSRGRDITNYGIYHHCGGGLRIVNNKFNAYEKIHYYSDIILTTVVRVINDNSFENHTESAIVFVGSPTTPFSGDDLITITGNEFSTYGLDGIDSTYHVILRNVNGAVVGDNVFLGQNTKAIASYYSQNVTIGINSYFSTTFPPVNVENSLFDAPTIHKLNLGIMGGQVAAPDLLKLTYQCAWPVLQAGVLPGVPSYGSIHLGNITPTSSNYSLTSDNSDLNLNASNSLQFQISAANKMVVASTGQIKMNSYGSSTFTGTAATYPAFDASGNIIEVSGIGSGPVITADNGLTKNSATNVQLGGTLLANTTINTTSSYSLYLTGARTGTESVLDVHATGASGRGATIQSDNSIGLYASGGLVGGYITSPSGLALSVQSSSGQALYAVATDGLPGQFATQPASNSTVLPIISLYRTSSTAAAIGNGASIDFHIAYNNATNEFLSNQLISKATNVTSGAQTSQLIITGVNSAATNNLLILKGDGTVNIPTNVQNFANNAAAITGGLAVGDLYRNGDALQIVH